MTTQTETPASRSTITPATLFVVAALIVAGVWAALWFFQGGGAQQLCLHAIAAGKHGVAERFACRVAGNQSVFGR